MQGDAVTEPGPLGTGRAGDRKCASRTGWRVGEVLTPSLCRPGGLRLMFLCSRCLLGLPFSAPCQEPHPCLGDPLTTGMICVGDPRPRRPAEPRHEGHGLCRLETAHITVSPICSVFTPLVMGFSTGEQPHRHRPGERTCGGDAVATKQVGEEGENAGVPTMWRASK